MLCTAYTNLRDRDSRLSLLDLDTGNLTPVDTVTPYSKVMMNMAVSEKDDLIFGVDHKHDQIRIYGLDGKLRRLVYGPDYKEDTGKYEYYFSGVEICGDEAAATYTGAALTMRDLKKDRKLIIMTDLEGKYLRTLRFDATIHGMAYHDKTRRLYLTTTGEPQIGYIELDKIPD